MVIKAKYDKSLQLIDHDIRFDENQVVLLYPFSSRSMLFVVGIIVSDPYDTSAGLPTSVHNKFIREVTTSIGD